MLLKNVSRNWKISIYKFIIYWGNHSYISYNFIFNIHTHVLINSNFNTIFFSFLIVLNFNAPSFNFPIWNQFSSHWISCWIWLMHTRREPKSDSIWNFSNNKIKQKLRLIRKKIQNPDQIEENRTIEDLDHGLSKDLNERLPLEPRRSETGRYNSNDPAPELAGSAEEKVSVGAEGHGHRSAGENAVDDPGFGGGWRSRRRRWGTHSHWIDLSRFR